MSGYLIAAFSRRTKLPLAFTKALTRGDVVSHCGVVVEATVGGVSGLMVVDSRIFIGVAPTPFQRWLDRYPSVILRAYEVPEPLLGQATAWDMNGLGYDLHGMVKAAIGLGEEDSKRPYCAEVISLTTKALGLDLFADQPAHFAPRPHEVFALGQPLSAVNDPFAGRLSAWYA